MQAAYEILYAVSPKIAQEFKPVRMSSEDNGIKMEVSINRPFSSSATCEMISYDEEPMGQHF